MISQYPNVRYASWWRWTTAGRGKNSCTSCWMWWENWGKRGFSAELSEGEGVWWYIVIPRFSSTPPMVDSWRWAGVSCRHVALIHVTKAHRVGVDRGWTFLRVVVKSLWRLHCPQIPTNLPQCSNRRLHLAQFFFLQAECRHYRQPRGVNFFTCY